MTTRIIECVFCKRYRGFDTEKVAIVCLSFPDGIPADILDGASHMVSRDGEMPFDPKDEEAKRLADNIWPQE